MGAIEVMTSFFTSITLLVAIHYILANFELLSRFIQHIEFQYYRSNPPWLAEFDELQTTENLLIEIHNKIQRQQMLQPLPSPEFTLAVLETLDQITKSFDHLSSNFQNIRLHLRNRAAPATLEQIDQIIDTFDRLKASIEVIRREIGAGLEKPRDACLPIEEEADYE